MLTYLYLHERQIRDKPVPRIQYEKKDLIVIVAVAHLDHQYLDLYS
jgi:hypothetical protein